MTQVELYDTTLRDGAQYEGISLSVEDKLTITDRLDQLGVHYIEGGWPDSNPKNAEFFERAKSFKLKNSVVTAFGSTRRANVDAANDPQIQTLLEAETAVVTLVGKSWDLHVTHILETSLEENLAMISDSISYLVSQGRRASFELLVRRTLPDYRAPFELVDFMTVVEKRSGSSDLSSQVMLKVKVGNEVMHTAADGNGPVNALDFARRKALLNFYPELKAVRLADYKVRGWIRAWELKPWSGFS